VSITDAKLGALTCTPLQPATLAPSAKVTCNGTYVTTQADLDAGEVDNTANASGSFGGTTVTSNQAQANVTGVRTPAVSIVKYTNGADADTAPGPSIVIGAPVQWTYSVRNTGNVTLNNIHVTDNKA
jgi:hypothetical protein